MQGKPFQNVSSKFPKHLFSGETIPFKVAPLYYYNDILNEIFPYKTLHTQSRTLKHSYQNTYESLLLKEFPMLNQLKYSHSTIDPLMRYNENVNEYQKLEFKQNKDNDNYCESLNELRNIVTPYNLYKTVSTFDGESQWNYGGFSTDLRNIPNSIDLVLNNNYTEICIGGHSNAGKSSLINKMVLSKEFNDFHSGIHIHTLYFEYP